MRFEAALEAKRQDLLREIHAQTVELTLGEGEHDPIDQVQSMRRRDVAAAMVCRLSSTLANVEISLQAMSEGCYGICVECEEPISPKRLEAVPWASHCMGCQELLERKPVYSADSAGPFDEGREAA